MRDPYAGDISDFLKLALLRELAGEGDALFVVWYYNPANDRRSHGCRREYCQQPKWRALDSPLWNELRVLPQRSVETLEKLSAWPRGTRFHRVPVPSMDRRDSWVLDIKAALAGSRIVFLDPDNGIGTTKRHATMAEIQTLRRPGQAIVVIKFPARESHDGQLTRYHASLRAQTGCSSLATLRTTVLIKQPTSRWFTIIDADETLMARAERFAHLLNEIAGCKCDFVRAPLVDTEPAPAISGSSRQRSSWSTSATERDTASDPRKACPECGQIFKGRGFDGIDAHWRAKHEAVMPYALAWPLVKSGRYLSPGLAKNPQQKG
jgi:hypothetical protein